MPADLPFFSASQTLFHMSFLEKAQERGREREGEKEREGRQTKTDSWTDKWQAGRERENVFQCPNNHIGCTQNGWTGRQAGRQAE